MSYVGTDRGSVDSGPEKLAGTDRGSVEGGSWKNLGIERRPGEETEKGSNGAPQHGGRREKVGFSDQHEIGREVRGRE